jgi:hypothetical protein
MPASVDRKDVGATVAATRSDTLHAARQAAQPLTASSHIRQAQVVLLLYYLCDRRDLPPAQATARRRSDAGIQTRQSFKLSLVMHDSLRLRWRCRRILAPGPAPAAAARSHSDLNMIINT